jgi:hypothetical protein
LPKHSAPEAPTPYGIPLQSFVNTRLAVFPDSVARTF